MQQIVSDMKRGVMIICLCFQAQMALKQQTLARERALAQREVEQALLAEQEYQTRLKSVLSNSQPQVDFRRKKVDWYN